jgi:hypothetical protein
MSKKNLLKTIKENADKATEHLMGDEDVATKIVVALTIFIAISSLAEGYLEAEAGEEDEV